MQLLYCWFSLAENNQCAVEGMISEDVDIFYDTLPKLKLKQFLNETCH